MRKIVSSVFILLFVSISAVCQTDNFLFRKISPPEGFTYGSIKTIAEDADGFIWFGTEHGLYRYNTGNVELFIHRKDVPYSLPNDFIHNIYRDKSGKLWITTKGGLCYYDNRKELFVPQKFKGAYHDALNASIRNISQNKNGDFFTLHENQVCRITREDSAYQILPLLVREKGDRPNYFILDGNILWVGTMNGYIFYSRSPYKVFNLFCHHRSESVTTMCMDKNTVWIGYEWGGVDHVNEYGAMIKHYDQKNNDETRIPHNRIRMIKKDKENRILIATYDGMGIFSNNKMHILRKDYYNNMPHNSIHSIFVDSRNCTWIGTWAGGLAFTSTHDNHFMLFNRNPGPSSLSSNVVSSFAEEKDGSLLVGTENGEIDLFNRQKKTFSSFSLNGTGTGTNNIKSLCIDKNNRLWVGTLSSGLFSFDIQSHSFRHHDIFNTKIVNVYDIIPVDNGLWLGTYGTGVFFYDFKTNQVTNYTSRETNPNTLSSNMVRKLLIDSRGGLWVATQSGLNYKPKGVNRFIRYFYNENVGHRISNNEIFTLHEDRYGKIWIGTGGGGVDIYHPSTGLFTNLSPKQGLAGYNVFGILEDGKGNLWFSTEKGLSCYSPQKQTFSNYDKEDGLQGNQFNPGAAFKCKNGEFMFGGPNGFSLFNPMSITRNPIPPRVVLTSLSINNQLVDIHDPDSKVKNDINTLEKIKLPYWQNSLSFEFVANNFILPHKNRFRYRLVNYQDEWIDANNQGKATFTKIPPGKYVFEVMASNNDGVWSKEPTRLEVIIRYPFWRSWFAYLFYLIILYLAYKFFRKEMVVRNQLSKQLLIERVQRENEENLHQLKLKIFTNISHEFRTPLTLILSPLESIMKKNNLDEDIHDHLVTIHRNAQRLRMLINQIIDFRKLEFNRVEYHPSRFDLIRLCGEVGNYYDVYAKDKAIDYSFESTFEKYEMEADSEKVDRIIFNLLSNAFKYTPEGGTIKISIEEIDIAETDETVFSTDPELRGLFMAIRVSDSGPGMPSEEVSQIFERFFSGVAGKNQGTGIGLNLCYEYARLHHGAITVKTEQEKGSVFSLLLPVRGKDESLAVSGKTSYKIVESTIQSESSESIPDSEASKGKATILIVEDNVDMQKQIRKLLSEEFKILSASNGQKGYEVATTLFPDLIISDVMMPVMSGFDLCKKIKENIQTSHIPVILLTALSETEMQIDGLNTGADAYIVKPFENKLLKAQINNLLASRRRLQQSFKESEDKWAGDASLMYQDKKLVERAIQIVEKHLLNPNFSVEQLAAELGLSRSSLHRKMRVLTNQSATEFIRYVRMKKAVKLMKEGMLNIDEVGFAVGFNSHSYFTQCFKRQFGKTPSEYLSELKMNGGDIKLEV